MSKPLKILRIVLLTVFVLIVVIVIAINLFANQALKIGIETAATKTLDVTVTVDSVYLSILGGKLELKNLAIDNPPGYQYDKLLELSSANIEVDIKSLLSDTVNIKQIKLDGVTVVLEQRGISSNNLQDIINTISASTKTKDEPDGEAKKLHVDNLEITNVTVKAKLLPVPGKAGTVTLKLAPIKMTNLGQDDKLDTAELSAKILLAIAKGIAEKGAGILPDGMVDTMKSTLDQTTKVLKATAEEGKKILETGKDIGEGVIEGLGNLLKPKK